MGGIVTLCMALLFNLFLYKGLTFCRSAVSFSVLPLSVFGLSGRLRQILRLGPQQDMPKWRDQYRLDGEGQDN